MHLRFCSIVSTFGKSVLDVGPVRQFSCLLPPPHPASRPTTALDSSLFPTAILVANDSSHAVPILPCLFFILNQISLLSTHLVYPGRLGMSLLSRPRLLASSVKAIRSLPGPVLVNYIPA